ncbi:MAG: hypothetical protein ABH859_02155 [Pseudomonadota bacterium]
MKEAKQRMENTSDMPKPKSAFELWKHVGMAKAQKVTEKGKVATDSMLAAYQNRFTYTFIMNDEVASIHFDRLRGEIFYKGHNINNLKLTPAQIQALKDLKQILAKEEKGKPFFSDYDATLAKCLADNNKEGESSVSLSSI